VYDYALTAMKENQANEATNKIFPVSYLHVTKFIFTIRQDLVDSEPFYFQVET